MSQERSIFEGLDLEVVTDIKIIYAIVDIIITTASHFIKEHNLSTIN